MNQQPTTKKSLGQHWLTDKSTLEAIVAAAGVTTDDTVLEIGPGTGTLTRELLKKAGKVVAVELDDALSEKLSSLEFAKNLQIVRGDILKFDLGSLPDNYKIVANIPYYLTAHLLRILTEENTHKPVVAVLLVQKEVAQRISAQPGKMSLISVAAQLYYEISVGQVVPAKLFTPPPKVDSQILILKKRQKPLIEVDTQLFFRIVKAGFSNRRKTLLNSLAGGLQQSKDEALSMLKAAGLNPTSRPQELSINDWYNLYQQSSVKKR